MTRRIVLHIGSPKCGSTYLQRVMLKNASVLTEHGVRYPDPGDGHPGNAGALPEVSRAEIDGWFADGVETVVLSHEDLFSKARTAQRLMKIAGKTGTEVQVIAFLRPFSDFLFGDYSQFMKQHFPRYLASRNPYDGRSFRDLIVRRVDKLNAARFLTNWQRIAGDAPIRVAGHREIKPVVEELIGALPLDWSVERHETNPSLRMEDCDRIAAALRRPHVPNSVIEQMYHAAFFKVDRPDSGRNAARRAVIEEMFAEENAQILEAFGYDNRLKPD
ncbi:hypothetical protein ROJ8625_02840 [Roseivivax jejudonensis]|uniref:Sulfotransferase domain protein n=1 Tax=Roseivivax jejudonensis TaxID=1529041 RepID=A0A1X6ZP13_9RHOB|nr:hypothetical protein [Roseivivax jejudonensis]SLN56848.1 hypothetical protein ROJ8625_02840 [Roseivivax jejudonensis]